MTVIQASKRYVGLKENPPKSNRHPDIDRWFRKLGLNVGQAWCACFVSNMFLETTGEIPDFASASSQAIKRWGQSKGRYFTDPQYLYKCKGAIFGWTLKNDPAHGHVGLVRARYTSNGEIIAIGTIEGNTNGGGARLGDGVYELRRGVPVDGTHQLWFINTTGLPGGDWWKAS